jgi:hypothetical protein
MSTLRKQVEEAIEQIETYKNPDISEVRQRLDAIFEAAGKAGVGQYDDIESLCFVRIQGIEHLQISLTWMSRQCQQGATRSVPAHIIDSDDPIAAAKTWYLDCQITKAQESVELCQKRLTQATEELNRLIALRAGALTDGA